VKVGQRRLVGWDVVGDVKTRQSATVSEKGARCFTSELWHSPSDDCP